MMQASYSGPKRASEGPKVFAATLIMLVAALGSQLLTSCSSSSRDNEVIISVKDQKMLLVSKGNPVQTYPVSTSKFGLGCKNGSMCTPLGQMEVAKKIGGGAPAGAVFKSRKRTGEILRVNAPGRDPIVSRILWLNGKQPGNRNTYSRLIYIHGTPEERHIGHKVSYGCIRMKSRDIIKVYNQLAVGSRVQIIPGSLRDTAAGRTYLSKRKSTSRQRVTRLSIEPKTTEKPLKSAL